MLFKQCVGLHKDLGPDSAFHKRRDIEELKRLTLKVQTLMSQLPETECGRWKNDMVLAMKGIVQDRLPPKKAPKPELNVEDLYDC